MKTAAVLPFTIIPVQSLRLSNPSSKCRTSATEKGRCLADGVLPVWCAVAVCARVRARAGKENDRAGRAGQGPELILP
jgi:hypothetical protein